MVCYLEGLIDPAKPLHSVSDMRIFTRDERTRLFLCIHEIGEKAWRKRHFCTTISGTV